MSSEKGAAEVLKFKNIVYITVLYVLYLVD